MFCEFFTWQPVRDFSEAELDRNRDLNWQEAVAQAAPVNCVLIQATDPLYILYTSGTTGMPKEIMRDNGGHAVALNWSNLCRWFAAGSGKILCGTIRSIVGGKEYRMPSTVDDPTVLDEITEYLKLMGYPER